MRNRPAVVFLVGGPAALYELYSEVFAKSVHVLGLSLLYQLMCMICGREECLSGNLPEDIQQCLFCSQTNNKRNPECIHVLTTVSNGRVFDSPCLSEIYLPTEMKAEPHLSLVRDEPW